MDAAKLRQFEEQVLAAWSFVPFTTAAGRPIHGTHLRGVGLEDTFQFECTLCGNCCVDRHQLLSTGVTAWEICRIAAQRGLHDLDRFFFTRISGSAQWLQPQMRQPSDRCIFLRGSRCLVHQVKPLQCRLAPLGITLDEDNLAIGLTLPVGRESWCPGMGRGRVWTVKEWLVHNEARSALAHMVAELGLLSRIYQACKPLVGPNGDGVPAYLPGEMCEWVQNILWHSDAVWEHIARQQGLPAPPPLPDAETRWALVMQLWAQLADDLEAAFAQGPAEDKAKYAWERLGFQRRERVVALGASPKAKGPK